MIRRDQLLGRSCVARALGCSAINGMLTSKQTKLSEQTKVKYQYSQPAGPTAEGCWVVAIIQLLNFHIVAGAANENVVTVTANESVISRSAKQLVVSIVAKQAIVSRIAL